MVENVIPDRPVLSQGGYVSAILDFKVSGEDYIYRSYIESVYKFVKSCFAVIPACPESLLHNDSGQAGMT